MATDFFGRQEDARRQTGRLVLYFVLAVAAIILAVYAAYTGILIGTNARGGEPAPALFDPIRLAGVAVATGLVILLGSLYKIIALGEGGAVVARSLGGRLLDGQTNDPHERRLLNVVEEMALASGTPVPPVYLLDEESAINAFAAGRTPGDSVIGVTRGAMELLSRDQMQGVIAHEFSHILNGDVRLDIRLLGTLHGILLLALIGQILMRMSGGSRSSSSDDNKGSGAAAFVLMGVALYAVGYIGVFFGRLIKSAVSRQREFLADASAVQFTRNPEGLAGALKKIGGLAQGATIRAPEAEETAHMFFGEAVSTMTGLLSTHPPLEERIRRLDPNFDGRFDAVEEDRPAPVEPEPRRRRDGRGRGFEDIIPGLRLPGGLGGAVAIPGAAAVATIGAPTAEHVEYASALLDELPQELLDAAREPFGASALIYALLLDPGVELRAIQFEGLATHAAPGQAEEAVRLSGLLDGLGPEVRVPLVDLAMPALRMLSPEQYASFRSNIDPLIRADGQVTLFEFALRHMLLRHTDQHFRRKPPHPVRFRSMAEVASQAKMLLSSLAWVGADDPDVTDQSFEDGARALGPDGRGLRLVPREACSMQGIDAVLNDLAATPLDVRRGVLEAAAATISADGRVTVAEGELLRAIADSLDCPMPPLLEAPWGGRDV